MCLEVDKGLLKLSPICIPIVTVMFRFSRSFIDPHFLTYSPFETFLTQTVLLSSTQHYEWILDLTGTTSQKCWMICYEPAFPYDIETMRIL